MPFIVLSEFRLLVFVFYVTQCNGTCSLTGMMKARSGKPISDSPKNTTQTRIQKAGYVQNICGVNKMGTNSAVACVKSS